MAEKMYKVLDDKRYAGKRYVHCGNGVMGRTKGDIFPERELSGNEENLKMALEGSNDKMNNRQFKWKDGEKVKDKNGEYVQGDEFVAIKGKDPVIELVKTPEKKGKRKKEDEKK